MEMWPGLMQANILYRHICTYTHTHTLFSPSLYSGVYGGGLELSPSTESSGSETPPSSPDRLRLSSMLSSPPSRSPREPAGGKEGELRTCVEMPATSGELNLILTDEDTSETMIRFGMLNISQVFLSKLQKRSAPNAS